MFKQKKRKLVQIISLLLFPITLFYFSPALIINAGMEGVINGSFIVFAALFLSGVFFGRLFCAYVCPAGALQECVFPVQDNPPKQGRLNYLKYGIWGVWMAAVILSYVHHGRILKIDFFFMTEHGISVSNTFSYIIYYGIILLILLPALIGGKRAFCHYLCWMAPFMALGVKVGRLLRLPCFHISADSKKCISCKRCDKACPMCVDVENAVKSGGDNGAIKSPECVQCGACVDICPKNALMRKMGR